MSNDNKPINHQQLYTEQIDLLIMYANRIKTDSADELIVERKNIERTAARLCDIRENEINPLWDADTVRRLMYPDEYDD